MKFSRRTALKIGAASFVAGTGVGVLSSRLETTRREFHLPNWKADGFRVAQVSDVHLIHPGQLESARDALRIAIAAKPDLFVLTGDFVNHDDAEQRWRIVTLFSELSKLDCPSLAILGNHDYGCGVPGKVAEAIAMTPLRLLVNEAVDVGGVRVVGLDDANESRPDYGLVATKDASSTLVLLHEPDYVSEVPKNAGLVLSGHSHGGEICLPGGKPLYTPRGAKRYIAGFYDETPVPLYVNRGTATLGPARVYCPPEVAILTLRTA